MGFYLCPISLLAFPDWALSINLFLAFWELNGRTFPCRHLASEGDSPMLPGALDRLSAGNNARIFCPSGIQKSEGPSRMTCVIRPGGMELLGSHQEIIHQNAF